MTEPIIYKTCARCKQSKPLSGFHQDSTKKDGLSSHCGECRNAQHRSPEARTKRKAWDDSNRERRNTYHRELRKADPDKRKARRRTEEAKQKQREYNNLPVVKERKRQYRERNRERLRLRSLEYSRTEQAKARGRESHFKRKYGITSAEYDTLMINQKGVCAICRKRPTKYELAVDHDHATGVVRGLLCAACNTILGRWDDSPETAERAKQYLLKHRQLKLVV